MEQCKDFSMLKSLLKEGEELGLDLSILAKKIEEYIEAQKSGTIKIMLLGSFSDGKTTAIAGLLGKLEDNMKIDEDESSDELSVYHIESLGRQYEIVDTPGLFGTKTKEVDGVNMRLSEETEKRISEAHIVIYVCSSVNTLKDSHKDIIRKVLRDYNKLSSTIFVINKMDDVADTNDEEEYEEMALRKRNTFIDRLRQVIGLTPDEENNLNIACIAANPKGKGLAEWFQKKEEYARRSHIGQLDKCVKSVVSSSDSATLKSDADRAVALDVVRNIAVAISSKVHDFDTATTDISYGLSGMESDLAILKSSITQSKGIMTDRLKELSNSLCKSIDRIGSLSDMASFLEQEIGIENNKVDFNIVRRRVFQIMEECAEANDASITAKAVEFERKFSAQDDIINDIAKGFLAKLMKIKIDNKDILKARDMFWKSKKFRPHGAKNLAKGFTTKVNRGAAILTVLIEGWNLYSKWRDAKKLEECKKELKDVLNGFFKQIYALFDDNDAYYKNFAPSYPDLVAAVKARRDDLQELTTKVSMLKTYRSRIEEWFGSDIKDADFEEIE